MRWILPLILSLIVLSSCSFVDEEETEHEKEARPDIILENTSYTLGQDGERPVYIASSRMVFWNSEEKAETGRIAFYQMDDEGEIALRGRADRSEIDTGTKLLRLYGEVLFFSEDGNMRIEAEDLTFDSENSELSSDGRVSVSSEDGTFQGEGFQADLITSTYTFNSIDKGIFTL